MRYPWRSAKHKTFTAYFPEKFEIVDVVDVVYAELEDLRFSFLHSPYPDQPERCTGVQNCEGMFTEASEAALLVALELFGGWLRVRTPGSMADKDTNFKVTDYVHERSPFFKAVTEAREFMPLCGACEVVKAARSAEKRQRLLDIVGAVPLVS
jgi:hypothetical protein